MKLTDKIADLFWRLRKWYDSINWRAVGRDIINFIGRVMHKVLFEWLMPKKYRGIKKQEIYEIIFKSDTPAGKKFDVWLLILIVANIFVIIIDSLFGSTSTITSGARLSASFWIIKALEWGFTLLFTFEYYLRIYCLKRPWKSIIPQKERTYFQGRFRQ